MRTSPPSSTSCAAIAAILVIALAALSACSTVSGLTGSVDGASTEKAARNVEPTDPLARPTQVGWTSARATRCGFIFNPNQLRSDYFAAELAAGRSQAEMKKIKKAYNYTHESVTITINDNHSYCNKERLDAIRADLNRYLSGDYRAKARMAR
jgi:hypothetical protein